ncbi:MAG: cytochrome c4 [Dechloromonas sp.]|nr:MAG: cytochrome c4 [Dechloromonas sp.]
MRAWIIAAGIMVASGVAFAQTPAQDKLKAIQADPAALKQAIEAGQKASFFCVNCHGESGISKIPEVPNLAGQNPAYLLEQIRKFGSGERKDQFMQGLIKVLKDDERIQIALFFGSQAVPPSKADPVQVARGKELFTKLCVRCHGEAARGDATIPRLAGQQIPYVVTSVTRYRDGTGIRNNQLMSIATSSLKNEDIKAIANYLTQLP